MVTIVLTGYSSFFTTVSKVNKRVIINPYIKFSVLDLIPEQDQRKENEQLNKVLTLTFKVN